MKKIIGLVLMVVVVSFVACVLSKKEKINEDEIRDVFIYENKIPLEISEDIELLTNNNIEATYSVVDMDFKTIECDSVGHYISNDPTKWVLCIENEEVKIIKTNKFVTSSSYSIKKNKPKYYKVEIRQG